ncbi:glycosyl transferase [Tenacibaculum discolor]|uniref:Glycosyl transferase n=1 Tax=Tenacibaculum discolor TaxID=361581 RepID=A0A2G1BRL7_9FLAO|nr:glycosyltransferase family protein [Tenacibaculum discolor]MDP2540894.1 glycosyltransferase family protein [Tenacibaculum discolor]PHN96489.1 glycosyl transferase [Tenacibaculum discolor]PHO00328.1 glycosyl transferase [Rhodobacteraceae bacterium 4F10]
MKILYAFQGTGNGHASRALEIIPHLQRRGDVDVLVSGSQYEIELPFNIKYKLHGLGFVFGKKGGIDLISTLKDLNLKKVYKEIKMLPVKEYDLVINDFEPISAWACLFRNVPIISLSNQNALLNEKNSAFKKFRLERLIIKYYAPAKNKFGFHFKTHSSSTFLPIIRKEIRYRNITNKGHYTVYLPSYSDEKIVKILSKIKDIKWQVFSKKTKEHQFFHNITILPINDDAFIRSMASAKGVICGAGFATPTEALYLRKKLLVIPMKNQYEQQCNAVTLKEMGVTVVKKLSKKQLPKIEKWINTNKIIEVHYPDVTEDMLDAIILPYYNKTILPEITIE